jgi:hypothetical protein
MPSVPFAGIQTIIATNVGQPVFGTTTTSAASPTYDQFVGNMQGANPSTTVLTVISTKGFNPGQYVLVGISAQLGSANPNLGQVKVVTSSTSMTVRGLNQSVASGAFVILAEAAESITISLSATDAGQMYVGNAYTVSPTDQSVIDTITPGYRFHVETTDTSHAQNTANYWIAGTVNDTFISSFTQG